VSTVQDTPYGVFRLVPTLGEVGTFYFYKGVQVAAVEAAGVLIILIKSF